MGVLWVNFLIVYLSAFFARYFSTPNTQGINYVKPNKFLILISLTSLVIVSGLRNNIGDTYFYMHSYIITEFNWSNFKFEADFGFNILQILLQKLSDDPQILIFVTALVTNTLILLILFKYSRRIELSLFVYIASGMYLVSMNGIRQALAASIVFTATRFIINGNFLNFFIVILLASTIHQTAIIFVPIYFIVRQKAWTKITMILLGSGVIIALGFNEFSKLLFSAIEDTKYGQYSTFNEGGASFIRVVVGMVPLVIAYMGREKLKQLWSNSDYIVNLSVLSLLFLIVSTQNWIFARFNVYFGLYNLILISWLSSLFSKNAQRLTYLLILISFLIFFYYEHIISLGIYYTSKYIEM
jgi:transmembrane protein EpsG